MILHIHGHQDTCLARYSLIKGRLSWKCQNKVTFNDKAKVQVPIQRACTFKKKKLEEEAKEESMGEALALACVVSTQQYAIVWPASRTITGLARVM
jgi:hypothetical protein